MDIDTWLSDVLTASPAPTTLGTRIYPVIAPPKTLVRHSVFQRIGHGDLLQTQDGDPEGTRIWRYQFKQYSPLFSETLADTESLRAFLVGYRDWPARRGIMRVLKMDEHDLGLTAVSRLFTRILELEITENL